MRCLKGKSQFSPFRLSLLAGILLFLSQSAFAVAPTVVSAIPDTTVNEDNPAFNYRDLHAVFDDLEDDPNLAFTIESNSNPGLVTVSIDPPDTLDTGFLNPSATGDDYNQWSNPSLAYASDNQDASEDRNLQQQDWFNFNFVIPAGAAIEGIQVDVEGNNQWEANGIDIELSWDGGTTYTTSGYGAIWPLSSSDSYQTFGDSVDTWGRTWAATDFSNANFRIRFTKKGSIDYYAFEVDHIQAKVYYTPLVDSLNLSFAADSNGTATIVVRATDSVDCRPLDACSSIIRQYDRVR